MLDWSRIDTVLLDMDGTLLDLHFDNHFWREHVPLRYAEKHGLAVDTAHQKLAQRFAREEATLNWYCVDYWTRELDLDIVSLKEEVAHLIQWRPDVPEFLAAVRASGRRLVLVTNAHGKTVTLKFRMTQLGDHLDQVVCSHDLGHPKEHAAFWERMQSTAPFDRARAVLIDDSLPVLRAARSHGVAQLLAIHRPDSKQPDKDVGEFTAIRAFREIWPE